MKWYKEQLQFYEVELDQNWNPNCPGLTYSKQDKVE